MYEVIDASLIAKDPELSAILSKYIFYIPQFCGHIHSGPVFTVGRDDTVVTKQLPHIYMLRNRIEAFPERQIVMEIYKSTNFNGREIIETKDLKRLDELLNLYCKHKVDQEIVGF